MIYVNPKAPCRECANNLRCTQTDKDEMTEKWVCDEYEDGVPETITIDGSLCKRFKKK